METSMWMCIECTLDNSINVLACSKCGTPSSQAASAWQQKYKDLEEKYKQLQKAFCHEADNMTLPALKRFAESLGITSPKGHAGRRKTWIQAIKHAGASSSKSQQTCPQAKHKTGRKRCGQEPQHNKWYFLVSSNHFSF